MLEWLFPRFIGAIVAWWFKDSGARTVEDSKTKVCQGGTGQRCLAHQCQAFRVAQTNKAWHRLIYRKRYICSRFR